MYTPGFDHLEVITHPAQHLKMATKVQRVVTEKENNLFKKAFNFLTSQLTSPKYFLSGIL